LTILTSETKLIRAVGRWDLIALAINGVIGTSIFGLPASVAALAGGWSPLACLFSGAIVMLIVLCSWLLTQSPARDLLTAGLTLAAGYALYGGNILYRRGKAQAALPESVGESKSELGNVV
jgi:amino acid transporter